MKDQLINKEFDMRMLEILVCPLSKDKLFYNKKKTLKIPKRRDYLIRLETASLC